MDREKAIEGLEWVLEDDRFGFGVNWENGEPRDDHEKAGKIITDALALLKEQEAVVLCKDCKHHRKDTCSAGAGMAVPPPDDWFCADGRAAKS